MAGYMDETKNINENNLNSATPIDGESYKKPTSLFSALSVIQRYYVIEKNSPEDLPKEYFTYEQVIDFVKVGFKSGFIESLLLVTLFPFLQTIYPSFKMYFFGEQLTQYEKILFEITSLLPIVVSTIFLMYLSKYYKGNVTKKAIFSLFSGRSVAFIIKGIITYYLLKYLYHISYIEPNSVYGLLDFLGFIINLVLPYQVNTEVIYDYYYLSIAPAIKQTSKEILLTMLFFALLPYITIFLKGLMLKKKKLEALEEYEKY